MGEGEEIRPTRERSLSDTSQFSDALGLSQLIKQHLNFLSISISKNGLKKSPSSVGKQKRLQRQRKKIQNRYDVDDAAGSKNTFKVQVSV